MGLGVSEIVEVRHVVDVCDELALKDTEDVRLVKKVSDVLDVIGDVGVIITEQLVVVDGEGVLNVEEMVEADAVINKEDDIGTEVVINGEDDTVKMSKMMR